MALESGTGACRDRLESTDEYVMAMKAAADFSSSWRQSPGVQLAILISDPLVQFGFEAGDRCL